MLKIAIGHSEDPYTEDAAEEVINQCRESLGNQIPKALILFAGIDYDFEVALKKIHTAFPNAQIVGCSSSGELSSRLGYVEGSLLLTAFASDKISMTTAVARDMSKDITTSVSNALKQVKKELDGEPKLCFIFPDIFTTGIVRLVEEIQKNLGHNIPIFGGGASDPWTFNQTREFHNEEVLQDAAPMLFFGGPLEYIFNVGSGWEPFTSQRPVIEAQKNIVYKIGDKTAFDFYKHYLGGAPTLAHPLAVFEKDQQRFYLRVALQTNEQDGSIAFGGDIPKQASTSICQADPDNLIQESKKLIQELAQNLDHIKPAGTIIFSCSCRQKILGTKTMEEYKTIQSKIPTKMPLMGYYAYGQVSPFVKDAPAFVHNESIVNLFLYESNDVS